mmetsp:Transcript_59489/g.181576  ORF Transcript_59489/g.181576 Transcript_59489/m.181576 type:complete len:297 (-) Transcript_59489:328-1218(-)
MGQAELALLRLLRQGAGRAVEPRPDAANDADVTPELLDGVVQLTPAALGLRQLLLEAPDALLLLSDLPGLHHALLFGVVDLHVQLVNRHLQLRDRVHLGLVAGGVVLLVAPVLELELPRMQRQALRLLAQLPELRVGPREVLARRRELPARLVELLLALLERRLLLGDGLAQLVRLALRRVQVPLELRGPLLARRELRLDLLQGAALLLGDALQRRVLALERRLGQGLAVAPCHGRGELAVDPLGAGPGLLGLGLELPFLLFQPVLRGSELAAELTCLERHFLKLVFELFFANPCC